MAGPPLYRASPSTQILSLAPEGCIAFDRGILLSVHRAPVFGARVGEVRRAIETAASLAPRGLVSIGVFRLSPEFPLGTGALSNVEELAGLLRAFERHAVAQATILDFGGMRAAAMKAMIRAIVAIARPRVALATFDRLTDAVTWVLPHAARARAPRDHAAYLRLYQTVERQLDELDARRGATRRSARA